MASFDHYTVTLIISGVMHRYLMDETALGQLSDDIHAAAPTTALQRYAVRMFDGEQPRDLWLRPARVDAIMVVQPLPKHRVMRPSGPDAVLNVLIAGAGQTKDTPNG